MKIANEQIFPSTHLGCFGMKTVAAKFVATLFTPYQGNVRVQAFCDMKNAYQNKSNIFSKIMVLVLRI